MSTLQRILATELTPKANPKVGDVWETRMDNALSPIIKSGSARPDPNYTLPAGITVRILHHDNRNEVRFRSPGGASVLSISDFSRNYKFKKRVPIFQVWSSYHGMEDVGTFIMEELNNSLLCLVVLGDLMVLSSMIHIKWQMIRL